MGHSPDGKLAFAKRGHGNWRRKALGCLGLFFGVAKYPFYSSDFIFFGDSGGNDYDQKQKKETGRQNSLRSVSGSGGSPMVAYWKVDDPILFLKNIFLIIHIYIVYIIAI